MQRRIVDPPIDQWDLLPTPLMPGEETVYNLFYKKLPPNWEMYIQPYLNGLRPDLVLLNPNAGIAVFEVKDWKYSTVENVLKSNYKIQNPLDKISLYKDRLLEIYCPRLKERFENEATATVTAGLIFSKVSEAQLQNLFGRTKDGKLCCRVENPNTNLEPLFATYLRLSKYYPLVGKETLLTENLDKLFPEWKRFSSKFINEDTANDLRGWLKDPAFSQELRQPLNIDTKDLQIKEIIENNRKAKYRRVKGTAGSGKSLTLAMRAAELASQNKQVLVCSYNITLMNYLRPIAYRHARHLASLHIIDSLEVIRHKIVFLHFHAWCKRVCLYSGKDKDYDRLWITYNQLRENKRQLIQEILNASSSIEKYDKKNRLNLLEKEIELEKTIVLNNRLPELIQQIYNESLMNTLAPQQLIDPFIVQENVITVVTNETKKDVLPRITPPLYDAILVDEGQDYIPLWWQTLRKALKQDGEMLLVADKTQNIYGTAQAWTEETMKGAGFSGDWMRLKSSYRIPHETKPILENFVTELLIPQIRQCQGINVDITDIIDIPEVDQIPLEEILYDVEFQWIQVLNPVIEIDVCFEAVRQQMLNLPTDTAISDIVFLAQNMNIGQAFVEKCKQKNIFVNHTFGQNNQRKKMAFFLDHSTIKATTLHSFKGWEGRLLVLHVNKITDDKDCALFYTALTRLKRHPHGSRLTVVSSCPDPKLQDFGSKMFPIYSEKTTMIFKKSFETEPEAKITALTHLSKVINEDDPFYIPQMRAYRNERPNPVPTSFEDWVKTPNSNSPFLFIDTNDKSIDDFKTIIAVCYDKVNSKWNAKIGVNPNLNEFENVVSGLCEMRWIQEDIHWWNAVLGDDELENAVLKTVYTRYQTGKHSKIKDISEQLGIHPPPQNVIYNEYIIVQNILCSLEKKKVVRRIDFDTWQMTKEGEAYYIGIRDYKPEF